MKLDADKEFNLQMLVQKTIDQAVARQKLKANILSITGSFGIIPSVALK
jgi:hypothetical protein